jgi:hypothetical protein
MKRIQVVKDNVVVNVLSFENGDNIASDKMSIETPNGVFPAPDGCTFMSVDEADKGWIVSGDTLVAPATPVPHTPTSSEIKSECQRRIYAIASPDCQMNMTAYIAAGGATDADKTAFSTSLTWVMAMRAKCITFLDSLDPTFRQDSHWPVCPDSVIALAAKF